MNPETLALFKATEGAISIHEMHAISWLASQAPGGVHLDIGTNAGKAAIASADGMAKRGVPLVLNCVDMVFDVSNEDAWKDHRSHPGPVETGWTWIFAHGFAQSVKSRIEIAGTPTVKAAIFGESALTAVPRIGAGGIAWAFCDADNNQPELVHEIVDMLAPLMVVGGIIAHHDFASQFQAPKEAQDALLATGLFERIEIPWKEFMAATDACGGDHGGNNSWHHRETERPMFVGAVRRINATG